MSKLTLAQRLTNYLQKCNEYVPKGELERIVLEKTTYTADNTGRTLRKLAEEGTLLVKQVRGHSHYKFNDNQGNPAQALVDFENYQPIKTMN